MRNRIFLPMTDKPSLLAANVKWLLAKAGLNPTSLSAALGKKADGTPVVPQATIFRIAEGLSENPRNATLNPIAEFFRVRVSDLWEHDFANLGRPAKSIVQSIDQGRLASSVNDSAAKVKKALRDLNAADRNAYDARDVLFLQNLLADLKADALSSFDPSTDGDQEE